MQGFFSKLQGFVYFRIKNSMSLKKCYIFWKFRYIFLKLKIGWNFGKKIHQPRIKTSNPSPNIINPNQIRCKTRIWVSFEFWLRFGDVLGYRFELGAPIWDIISKKEKGKDINLPGKMWHFLEKRQEADQKVLQRRCKISNVFSA